MRYARSRRDALPSEESSTLTARDSYDPLAPTLLRLIGQRHSVGHSPLTEALLTAAWDTLHPLKYGSGKSSGVPFTAQGINLTLIRGDMGGGGARGGHVYKCFGTHFSITAQKSYTVLVKEKRIHR